MSNISDKDAYIGYCLSQNSVIKTWLIGDKVGLRPSFEIKSFLIWPYIVKKKVSLGLTNSQPELGVLS